MGIVAQTVGMVIGIMGLFYSGFIAGRAHEKIRKIDLGIRRSPEGWQQLPSGWSTDFGTLTIYAMTMDDGAYWWVSRNGKTIIEGPSSSLGMAKVEAEREAKELSL